ncbi:MAG: hypothetical protein EZS28_036500, partial [Streblomastix strix]
HFSHDTEYEEPRTFTCECGSGSGQKCKIPYSDAPSQPVIKPITINNPYLEPSRLPQPNLLLLYNIPRCLPNDGDTLTIIAAYPSVTSLDEQYM